MRVVSVNTGGVRNVAIHGDPEPTAFRKIPTEGPVEVTADGLAGDRLGTPRSLGVANHAVYIYPLEHYPFWEADLGKDGLPAGSFGENLTVEGIDETDLRIGDELVVGSARLRVIQPRIPCYKLAHFLNAPRNFPARFLRSARVGAFCSVVHEGVVEAGDTIERVAGDPSNATIAEFVRVTQFDTDDVQGLTALLDSPGLIPGWKARVEAQLSRATGSGSAGWAGWRRLRCTQRAEECAGIASFVFSDADGGPLAPCVPGQFLTARIGAGQGSAPAIRTYTISGAYPSYDSPSQYRITVKREERNDGCAMSASSALHDDTDVGAEIEARPPAGKFTLDLAEGRPIVLVAGGIGITPMVAMLNALAAKGDRRELVLVHATRDSRHRPLADEIASLSGRLANLTVRTHHSQPEQTGKPGSPRAGRLKAADIVPIAPRDAAFFLCGPGSFMREITAGLVEAGIEENRIHSEAFGPSSLASGPANASSEPIAERARIRFETSGLEADWTPADGPLLDFMEARGIVHDSSCRSGICQTCAAELVSGQVAYPPGIAGAGPAHVLLCSAMPASDLVLRA